METKRFSKNDAGFLCAHCGREVAPLGYTSRNHCPFCLWSLHVDVMPGDRQNPCRAPMRPLFAEPDARRGYIITHECTVCGEETKTVIPASGHTPGEAVEENYRYLDGIYCCDHVVRCAKCGCEVSRDLVELYLLGDANGDGEISVLDAMVVAQYIVGDIDETQLNLAAANVNGDEEISVLDAMLIAQHIVGDITQFPAEQNG
jgi:DNA-directed RNA polymerase subunit RPC12/RpoP